MSSILNWSTTAGNNNSAAPDGFPENMAPSGVNDAMREVMAQLKNWQIDSEWVAYGNGDGTCTFSRTLSNMFKIEGSDVTGAYTAGRRVKVIGATTGTIYGTIDTSTFSTDTHVTVIFDDADSIVAESISVFLGIQSPTGGGSAARRRVQTTSTSYCLNASNGHDLIVRMIRKGAAPNTHNITFLPTADEVGPGWRASVLRADSHSAYFYVNGSFAGGFSRVYLTVMGDRVDIECTGEEFIFTGHPTDFYGHYYRSAASVSINDSTYQTLGLDAVTNPVSPVRTPSSWGSTFSAVRFPLGLYELDASAQLTSLTANGNVLIQIFQNGSANIQNARGQNTAAGSNANLTVKTGGTVKVTSTQSLDVRVYHNGTAPVLQNTTRETYCFIKRTGLLVT